MDKESKSTICSHLQSSHYFFFVKISNIRYRTFTALRVSCV